MTSYPPYPGAWRDHCSDCYSNVENVDLPYGDTLCRSCAAARQTGADIDVVRRLTAGYRISRSKVAIAAGADSM